MKLNFNALAFNALMAVLIAFIIAPFAPAAAMPVGLGVFTVGCLLPAQPAGQKLPFAFLGIQRTIWVTDIAENVYPNNSFMLQSRDDSALLEEGSSTVKLNQAGGKPNTKKNRTQLPAQATRRTDTTEDYTIDEFTTDPIVIKNTEEAEANYPLRTSILFDHIETLKVEVAEGMLVSWAPTVGVNIIKSTGAARDPYKAFQLGAGKTQRRRLVAADITRAATIMNSQDVPQGDRYMLIDALLVADLLALPEYTSLEKIGKAVLIDGAIGMVMGFQVFVRSSALIYGNTTGLVIDVASGEVTSSNDNVATLFWHKNYVRRCFGGKTNGGIQVFEDAGTGGNGSPLYYGTVLSALVRSGGRIARSDERGVVVLVEDHV